MRGLRLRWVQKVGEVLVLFHGMQGVTSYKNQLIAQTRENLKLYHIKVKNCTISSLYRQVLLSVDSDGYSYHCPRGAGTGEPNWRRGFLNTKKAREESSSRRHGRKRWWYVWLVG
jgi:hypothetical protein